MLAKFLPIYVISLERAFKRREQISVEFARMGMNYVVFPGIDGQAHESELLASADPAAWRSFMGSHISAGHMGCYASHVQLWKYVGEGEDPIVLICEDDISFHSDFPEALQAALEMSDFWDICRFAKIRAKGALIQRRLGPWRLNAYWGPFTGNACYLIKRELAARLALDFWPIQRAHDHELNRFFIHHFRLMGLEPFTATPKDQGESFITGKNMAGVNKLPWYCRISYYSNKLANYLRRISWLVRHGMFF